MSKTTKQPKAEPQQPKPEPKVEPAPKLADLKHVHEQLKKLPNLTHAQLVTLRDDLRARGAQLRKNNREKDAQEFAREARRVRKFERKLRKASRVATSAKKPSPKEEVRHKKAA